MGADAQIWREKVKSNMRRGRKKMNDVKHLPPDGLSKSPFTNVSLNPGSVTEARAGKKRSLKHIQAQPLSLNHLVGVFKQTLMAC